MNAALEPLLQPVPGDDPGGNEIRYDPVFLQLREARVEEDDLPAGDWSRERRTADWRQVVELAGGILAERSKDLQVAAWLAEGMLRREGLGGFATGLEIVAGLLRDMWEHLHPRVEDEEDLEFRASPLDWLGSYLAPTLRLTPITVEGHHIFNYRESRDVGYEADAEGMEATEARMAKIADGKLTAEAFDAAESATPKTWYRERVAEVDRCLAALAELETLGDERFGDAAPRYAPIQDALSDVRQAVARSLERKLADDPDPEPEPEPEPEFDTPEMGDDAGGDEGPGGVSSTGGSTPRAAAPRASAAPGSRAEAEERIAAAARFLRKDDPTNPASYLLLRGFRWGELRGADGTPDPRLLAAPPTQDRARLRALLLDAAWDELREACEEVMASPYGRGWLDLQRYFLEACDGLGSAWDGVAESVRGALRGLLVDIPDLPVLTLMDDTPTANGETRAWLEEMELLPADGAEGASGRPPPRGTRDAWDRAMERVRGGEPDVAIQLLIQQAERERSTRDRFLRRSQAARLMVESGRSAIARPMLEELMREIEEHRLDSYEAGEMVAVPMGLLYQCMLDAGESGSDVHELYLTICRLDPMMAIRIQPPGDS